MKIENTDLVREIELQRDISAHENLGIELGYDKQSSRLFKQGFELKENLELTIAVKAEDNRFVFQTGALRIFGDYRSIYYYPYDIRKSVEKMEGYEFLLNWLAKRTSSPRCKYVFRTLTGNIDIKDVHTAYLFTKYQALWAKIARQKQYSIIYSNNLVLDDWDIAAILKKYVYGEDQFIEGIDIIEMIVFTTARYNRENPYFLNAVKDISQEIKKRDITKVYIDKSGFVAENINLDIFKKYLQNEYDSLVGFFLINMKNEKKYLTKLTAQDVAQILNAILNSREDFWKEINQKNLLESTRKKLNLIREKIRLKRPINATTVRALNKAILIELFSDGINTEIEPQEEWWEQEDSLATTKAAAQAKPVAAVSKPSPQSLGYGALGDIAQALMKTIRYIDSGVEDRMVNKKGETLLQRTAEISSNILRLLKENLPPKMFMIINKLMDSKLERMDEFEMKKLGKMLRSA
jgi:arsenate reductase-like glutaredoxin family protein